MGPPAGAVSTGHGGGYPDPAATTPSAPGVGAYNGYGNSAATPAVPGMGAYNGYNGRDPNRFAPAQTPARGMPATDVPATSTAAGPPLGVSRDLQPLQGPNGATGTCSFGVETPEGAEAPVNDCTAETDITFTVEGMLSLDCPEFGPVGHTGENGEDEIEGTPGSTLTLPAGPCTLSDERGLRAGQWTVDARMDRDFCTTETPTVCLTDAEVRYIIPNGEIGDLIPDTDPATQMHNAAEGTVEHGPPWDAPPADEPEGGVTLNGEEGPMELVLGTLADHNVYRARWAPYLAVTIPENARPTRPGEEYLGQITYTVTGGAGGGGA